MKNKIEYASGYLDALTELDRHLTQEFARKGNLDNPTIALDILNSLIAKLHVETYQIYGEINRTNYEAEQEDASFFVAQFMDELFNGNVKLVDIREYIKQGGK